MRGFNILWLCFENSCMLKSRHEKEVSLHTHKKLWQSLINVINMSRIIILKQKIIVYLSASFESVKINMILSLTVSSVDQLMGLCIGKTSSRRRTIKQILNIVFLFSGNAYRFTPIRETQIRGRSILRDRYCSRKWPKGKFTNRKWWLSCKENKERWGKNVKNYFTKTFAHSGTFQNWSLDPKRWAFVN